jgi:stress-induced-phosphoprotein 1
MDNSGLVSQRKELASVAKDRGNGFFAEGKYVRAIEEYTEATQKDPSNPVYFNNLSAALCKENLFAGAEQAVKRALELDGDYVKAWAKQGDIKHSMEKCA